MGSRTAKVCHPGDGYICSSATVKPLILANPSDWEREVLCFGSAEYIRELEVKYLHALDARNDPCSFNKTNGGKNFNGAVAHSPETRAKMSAAKKGKKISPMSREQKDRMSATRTGMKYNKTKEKASSEELTQWERDAAKKRYQENKADPEFVEKSRKSSLAYYEAIKSDPVYIEKRRKYKADRFLDPVFVEKNRKYNAAWYVRKKKQSN